MRKYSSMDLLRFHKFANENDLKGLDLVKAYNLTYPELSAKQKLTNIAKALDMPNLLSAIESYD